MDDQLDPLRNESSIPFDIDKALRARLFQRAPIEAGAFSATIPNRINYSSKIIDAPSSGGAQTVTYSHDLGVIPNKIKVTAYAPDGNSVGTYDENEQHSISVDTGSGTVSSSGFAIHIVDSTSGIDATGDIQAVNDVSFAISWSDDAPGVTLLVELEGGTEEQDVLIATDDFYSPHARQFVPYYQKTTKNV